MAVDLTQALSKQSYPGRGIIIGKSVHEGKSCSVVVYFIMGRSENSRNRVFVKTSDGIRTEAKDPSKMKDSTLIIYNPVRVTGGRIIVTNGDQTDTIADRFLQEGSFESAVYSRTFEPDPPHFTPRISGISGYGGSGDGYKLSIIKAGTPYSKHTNFFAFDNPQPGFGHYIHTYSGEQDGRLLPFEGEPVEVMLQLHGGGIKTAAQSLADTAWEALDERNKISLYVRITDTDDTFEEVIINKNLSS